MTVKKAPRVKRKQIWVELSGDYEGFMFLLWVNAPSKLWADVRSGNEELAQEAATKIILEHNGWEDFDGEPYPGASIPEFWEEIPTELAACVLAAAQVEIQRLPNSITAQKRR